MTRSSKELCLADFSRSEILGLFDRADALEGGAPPFVDLRETPPSNEATPAGGVASDAATAGNMMPTVERTLTAESICVLHSLYRWRRDGQPLDELTVAWIGPATADLHAWLEAASILGIQLRMAVPDGFEPDAGLFLACEGRAPGRILRCRDEVTATAGAGLVLNPGSPRGAGPGSSEVAGLTAALAEFLEARGRGRVDFRALLDALPG